MSIAAGSAALAADPLVSLTAAGAFRDHAHAGVAGDGGVVIPAALIAYTDGALPSGWSDLSATYGGRTVVAMPSGGTNGATVLSPLTDAQSPTHTHTGPSHQHLTVVADAGTTMYLDSSNPYGTVSESILRTAGLTDVATETHPRTYTSAGGTGATGATAAHLPYVQLRMIKKS